MEVNIYIGSWALKLGCTQCGFCGLGSLEECKDNPILKLGGPGILFRLDLEVFFLGLPKGARSEAPALP